MIVRTEDLSWKWIRHDVGVEVMRRDGMLVQMRLVMLVDL